MFTKAAAITCLNICLIMAMMAFGKQSPLVQVLFIADDEHIYLYDVIRKIARQSSERLHNVLIADHDAYWLPGQRIGFLGMTGGVVGEIYLLDVRRKSIDHYQIENFNHREVAWSPDGTKVAFTDPNNTQIYLSERPDSFERITQRAGLYTGLTWSPDGKQLALVVFRRGTYQPALIDMQTHELSLIEVAGLYGFAPQWSPDSQSLIFIMTDGIYNWHIGDQQLRRLTELDGEDPVWSPDGTQIAFVLSDSAGRNILVMDADGGNIRHITNSGHFVNPQWSSDSRWLAFMREGRTYSTLYMQSIEHPDQPMFTVAGVRRNSLLLWQGIR